MPLLPAGPAIVWTIVFLLIVAAHARHARRSHGQRRLWHGGHVLMAVSMVFMYLPLAAEYRLLAPALWRGAVALAAIACAAAIVAALRRRVTVTALWALLIVDLAAMAYMWRADRSSASPGWLLLAYFGAQAVLWAGSGAWGSGLAGGRLTFSAGREVMSSAGVRAVSLPMCAMTLGMGYMVVAMHLA